MCFQTDWTRWISADLGFAYHFLPAEDIHHLLQLAGAVSPSTSSGNNAVRSLTQALQASVELQLSLRQILRLQKECSVLTASSDARSVQFRLVDALERLLLVQFMPKSSSELFHKVIEKAMGRRQTPNQRAFQDSKSSQTTSSRHHDVLVENGKVRIGDVFAHRRQPKHPEKVPQPLFFPNASQNRIMEDILRSYNSGEKAFLVIGNQVFVH